MSWLFNICFDKLGQTCLDTNWTSSLLIVGKCALSKNISSLETFKAYQKVLFSLISLFISPTMEAYHLLVNSYLKRFVFGLNEEIILLESSFEIKNPARLEHLFDVCRASNCRRPEAASGLQVQVAGHRTRQTRGLGLDAGVPGPENWSASHRVGFLSVSSSPPSTNISFLSKTGIQSLTTVMTLKTYLTPVIKTT